jgi:hypothetical protein
MNQQSTSSPASFINLASPMQRSISAIDPILGGAAATRTAPARCDGIFRGETYFPLFSRDRQSFSSHNGKMESEASSEMLEHGNSHLLDDLRIFAVEYNNIEADHKGQGDQ